MPGRALCSSASYKTYSLTIECDWSYTYSVAHEMKQFPCKPAGLRSFRLTAYSPHFHRLRPVPYWPRPPQYAYWRCEQCMKRSSSSSQLRIDSRHDARLVPRTACDWPLPPVTLLRQPARNAYHSLALPLNRCSDVSRTWQWRDITCPTKYLAVGGGVGGRQLHISTQARTFSLAHTLLYSAGPRQGTVHNLG